MSDILFKNTNKKILKNLAAADLKAHKPRYFLSGAVIFIAVSLMSVVFTVLINSSLDHANSAPYHVVYSAVNEKTKNKLLADADFEAAGVYKKFGIKTDNQANLSLVYMDAPAMSFLGFELAEGRSPEKAGEVMVSESYSKAFGLSIKDSLDFSYTNAVTRQTEQEQFTICGILNQFYNEIDGQYFILVSDSFRLAMAGKAEKASSPSYYSQTMETVDILAKLNDELSSRESSKIEAFLIQKGKSLGIEDYNISINRSYMKAFDSDPDVIIGSILFIIILMFSSSFVVYCIFSISIIDSIRMYAQLMSVGTTQKQIRSFLNKQGNMLALYFIPPGMVFSLAAACFISSARWIAIDIFIISGSGLLIFIMIKAALKRPAKMLSGMSPVDAMKYTGGNGNNSLKAVRRPKKPLAGGICAALAGNSMAVNRKKNRMAIISLSISGTLMIAFVILISSFHVPTLLMQTYPLKEDFKLSVQMDSFYEHFPQLIKNNPLSEELYKEICSVLGIDKVIKQEALVGRLTGQKLPFESDEDSIRMIESITRELTANAGDIIDGTIDYDKLEENDIIINQYPASHSSYDYSSIKAGDTITFIFDLGSRFVEKEFKVRGIAFFPSTALFYTTPETIRQITPYNNTAGFSIFCSSDSQKSVKDALYNIVNQNPDFKLDVYEDELFQTEGYMNIYLKSLYTIFIFILFFGILNMVNMLISSGVIRKREFALLQAVGMTNTQLRQMLYLEGMSISVKAALVSSVFGFMIGRLLCYLTNKMMGYDFVIFKAPVWPVILFTAVLIGLQMAVSRYICTNIQKYTLTERLRTE